LTLRLDWDLGEGLRVRTLDLSDAEGLFALVEANRDRLRPWMPWEPNTRGPEDVRAFIASCRNSETSVDGNGILVEGALAGTAGMRVDLLANAAEIGYWIDRRYEGRGIVTRVSERFLLLAFDELRLHRVELHAAVDNARSRAVAERLGMRQEGVLRDAERVHDGYHDLVVYAILEDEWRTPPSR
jgi:ribosomal-protein-serine acetyltransferase